MKKISVEAGIKALIFDCDGTLVNSMPLHMQAWKEAFKKFDVKCDEKFLFSLKGMKETDIIILYNQTFKTNLDPDEVLLAKHEFIKQHVSTLQPIEPVVEVARSFYGKLPIAVASGSVRNIVNAELNTIGIFHLFNFILTADDPYKPKPSPDIFYAAAFSMNVDPQYCLVFEDGDAGLEAASKAGMNTLDVRPYI